MKEGDKVNVVMTRNDVFSTSIQKYSPQIGNCIIKRTPSDSGDLFQFITEDGIEFSLNPQCGEFAGLELVKENKMESQDNA